MIYVSVADNEMICQDFVTNFISTKILILYDILGKREDYDVISWGLPQGTSKSLRLSSDFSVYIYHELVLKVKFVSKVCKYINPKRNDLHFN